MQTMQQKRQGSLERLKAAKARHENTLTGKPQVRPTPERAAVLVVKIDNLSRAIFQTETAIANGGQR